ncbi:thiosulfate dehydrogenase [quinone] large subunit [Paenibacillus shirakamiensis]|uniref:Thiosulfate dehydrogenase [quinone] large subunit n=1 Tax=Paenibacillus shirakamiensis TaxID=1265935 RepID=A0ABS4JC35_9BACL|nr:thiosulfate dehydrogenase [quinone] large subunit [Paenibacillus shirakamiensis]
MTIIRVYLGYEWIKGGWSKVTEGFDASGFLSGALAKSTGEYPDVQTWWASFLQHVAIPGVGFFNVLVSYGEFLVGLGLILGTFTTFAALMGFVMNLAYLLSGSVSTNAQMLVLEVIIIAAGMNAARLGLDYWLIPLLFKRKRNTLDSPSLGLRNDQSEAV